MLLARTNPKLARRRGAILLIVLTLIALFSVVGLAFAIYAESSALGSRTRREAKATSDDPPSADAAASAAIREMLYPAAGETGASYGIGNVLLKTTRGLDHATMVYGDHPTLANTIPYNGPGQFSESLTLPTATGTVVVDRREIINYSMQFPRLANGNFVAAANHVVDPSHTGFRNNAQLATSPGNAVLAKTYVARNAPYTYPDRLNPYVAMQDPATGRILVPSYHRPSLFITGSTLGADYSLDRSNPNWRDAASAVSGNFNAAGRYRILRPRPWDHRLANETEDQSQFPFPQPNPDGTVTGDVQNILQQDGRQQNDSVWIDLGLPVVQWRGRNVKPLVAATVLPLDGRVNVNVAGNPSGSSSNGFGPWEIGLGKITADSAAMVNTRTGGTTPNPLGTNVNSLAFASSLTQTYAPVNWDGSTVATQMTFPATGSNQSDPTYPSGFDSSTLANTEATSHPGLFNPYSWNAFTNPGKLFPHTDLRRAASRYAGKPYDYNAPFFGTTAPATLTGTGPGNASNQRRAMLTTASNSLARPGLVPNFADYTTNTVSPAPGPLELNAAGQLVFRQPTLTNPVVTGPIASDFGGALNLRNALANIGPVNLNRTLTDYRAAAGALSPTNLANFQAATNDRQTLARDIFVRLILATGAKAIVNPTAGTLTLPRPQPLPAATPPVYDLITPGDTSAEQYNALRYLAQLAANIVDLIDNDDVATQFVWNPISASGLFAPDTAYNDMFTLLSNPVTPQAVRDAYTSDRIVFGVEKPRAVINEVYGELVNDPNDMLNGMGNATMDYHARFWIELLNPGNTQDTTSALGDGTVQLRYALPDGVTTPSSPYRLRVYRSMDAGTVVTNLTALNNPTGDPAYPNMTTPAIDRDFSESDGGNAALRRITPNAGAATATTLNGGFAVFGPTVNPAEMGGVFNPNTTTTTPPAVVPSMTNGHFTSTLNNEAGTNAVMGNVVLLQRLACPYLPASTVNPYITVDYFQNATAYDVVRRANNSMADRTPTYGPASGRREPFYGRSALNVPQNMSNVAPMKPMFGHSLFSHNDGRNPTFQWLAHFDRALVNQTELQMLSSTANHHLTQQFADTTPTPQMHLASFGSTTVPLYRALELLTVKPWGYGLPNEGRVPGKININMIWSQSVLEALLDQNASNSFTAANVTTLWGVLQGTASDTGDTNYRSYTRTKATGGVGPTIDEVGATYTDSSGIVRGADRPFKPFGTASFAAGGILPTATGLADTLLRDGGTGTPAIFTGTTTDHPYQRAEMLRKMYNNITTTSDTYLVVMTVGFFEVRNTAFPISTTNPLVLGKEVSDQVSGDLRGKYVAILDRSMLATNALGAQVDKLWQAPISESPYDPGMTGTFYLRFPAQGTRSGGIQMLYEGQETIVNAGNGFIVGTGARAEPMTIAALGGLNPDGTPAPAFNATTGLATVTLTAPPSPTNLHHAGDVVSNGESRNPGPQPNFDLNDTRYKGVVPYFERVEIGK